MTDLRAEVEAEITAPGNDWEIVTETVLGESLPVFKHRLRSLPEMLSASARFGERDAMVYGDWRITFADQVPMVGSVAAALATKYGIGPGDRVAIWSSNRPEWVLTWWAAVSLGAIVTAFNDRWTPDEFQHAWRDSEPAVLFADRVCLDRVGLDRAGGASLDAPVVDFDSFAALLDHAPGAPLPDVAIAEDDPALILYTSGTTGRAKGALISHRALIGFVQVNACNMAIGMAMAGRFGITVTPEPARILLTSPLFHVSGVMAGVLLSTVGGDAMVMRSGRFDPHDVLQMIERERITHFAPLGSVGPRVLEAMKERTYDVSSVRQLGFGGAPLSPTLRARLLAGFPSAGHRFGMGYGSSETVSVVTSIGGPEFEQFPTSAGRVLPTVSVEIRDPDDHVVPDGVDGEIHVRSAYVMLGYWRNEAATAAAIKPGRWLATGDIGHMDNGMLYINSRARDMILRSGENIYPVEIEHRLAEHPSVAEAAVLGVDHEVLGQEVKAVVVPVAGATIDTDELAAFVRQSLAGYKVPTQWAIRTDELPRNAAGKVQKNLL